MSADFIADLERELLAAARRRAAGARRRPRIAWRAVPALAVLAALAIVAGIALSGRDGDGNDEISATPPRTGGVTLGLPGMARESDCTDYDPREVAGPPQDLADVMAVLRRNQNEADVLPQGSIPAPERWLPIADFDRRAVRRPGSGRLKRETHVVPTHDLRGNTQRCERQPRLSVPGVCLVAGGPGEPLLHRCFTRGQLATGRAVALADSTGTGARIVGLVPDGVTEVSITVRGRTLRTPVVENSYQRYLNHLRIGDRATVRMLRPVTRRVAPELRAALPILRDPADPSVSVPPAALAAAGAHGSADPRAARFAGGGDEIEYWVVPVAKRGAFDEACLIAVKGDGALATVCANADRIRRSGAVTVTDDFAAGLAPAGATRLALVFPNGTHEIPVKRGVAVESLPERFDRADLQRTEWRGGQSIAIFNATTVAGLGTRVRNRLARALRGTPYEGEAGLVGNSFDQTRERSAVLYAANGEAKLKALVVAEKLGLDRGVVGPLKDDYAALAGRAEVAVIVGRDKAP